MPCLICKSDAVDNIGSPVLGTLLGVPMAVAGKGLPDCFFYRDFLKKNWFLGKVWGNLVVKEIYRIGACMDARSFSRLHLNMITKFNSDNVYWTGNGEDAYILNMFYDEFSYVLFSPLEDLINNNFFRCVHACYFYFYENNFFFFEKVL